MAGFDAADLARRAAAMREQGVIVTRPKSNFKVTTRHLGGKKNTAGTDEEHDRAWWIEYEAQNRP